MQQYKKSLINKLAKSIESIQNYNEPIEILKIRVKPEWIDYNNHLTESRYLYMISLSSNECLKIIGMDREYLEQGYSLFTVESHLCYLSQAYLNDELSVKIQILGVDEKRIHLLYYLYKVDSQTQTTDLIFTCEQMLLHVNVKENKSAEIIEPVLSNLKKISVAHQFLPKPEIANKSILKLGFDFLKANK